MNVFPPSHYQSLSTLLWQMNKAQFERLWSPLKKKSCSESQKAYSLPRCTTSAFPWFPCAHRKPPDELSLRLTGDQSGGNQRELFSVNISISLVSAKADGKPVLPSWEKSLSQEQHLWSCNKGRGDTEYINNFSLLTPQIPKDDTTLGPLTKFPVTCSKQTDCRYQDAWYSTSSWKVLEDLWGGSGHRETNAAEVRRVQDMNLCNIPWPVTVSAWIEEDRRDLLSWASSTAACTSHSGKSVQERNKPQLWSQKEQCGLQSRQARYGYPPVCSISAALPYLTCVPLCLRENTCLVPRTYSHPLMCQRLMSLLKHGRTNFLGKFLSLEIWRRPAKFQFLLSQLCSWESWCHHCLTTGSWGHLVPVSMWGLSLRHAGTEQQPQHFNTSMGREWAAAFQKFSFTQKTRISLNVLSKHVIKQKIIIINPRLFWSDGEIWS